MWVLRHKFKTFWRIPLAEVMPRNKEDFKTKQTFSIFWEHVRRYPGLVFVLIFCVFGAIAAEAIGPYFYKQLFNLLNAGSSASQLFPIAVNILVAAGVGWFFWRVA